MGGASVLEMEHMHGTTSPKARGLLWKNGGKTTEPEAVGNYHKTTFSRHHTAVAHVTSQWF